MVGWRGVSDGQREQAGDGRTSERGDRGLTPLRGRVAVLLGSGLGHGPFMDRAFALSLARVQVVAADAGRAQLLRDPSVPRAHLGRRVAQGRLTRGVLGGQPLGLLALGPGRVVALGRDGLRGNQPREARCHPVDGSARRRPLARRSGRAGDVTGARLAA